MLAEKIIDSNLSKKQIKEDKILSSILTYQQYRHLKNKLSSNKRDRLILEFAWEYLLTTDEMKNIKHNDIVFITDEFTMMEIALIDLGDQVIEIEDSEMVYDIKRCIDDEFYRIKTSNFKFQNYKFKKSKYLLKPLQTNSKQKDEDFLINPSTALKNTIIQQGIKCPEYNIYNLNVDNIRRSKIAFMLAPENRLYFNEIFILELLKTRGLDHNFYWYKRIAEKKYKKH